MYLYLDCEWNDLMVGDNHGETTDRPSTRDSSVNEFQHSLRQHREHTKIGCDNSNISNITPATGRKNECKIACASMVF